MKVFLELLTKYNEDIFRKEVKYYLTVNFFNLYIRIYMN